MNILVKPIEVQHLDAVLGLALKTPELHTQEGEPDYYSKEQLTGFIENPDAIFLGAFVGNELIGFILSTYDSYAKETYLINLVVNNKHQHKGIGRLLFSKTLEHLKEKDIDWVWVLTREDNKRMRDFLQKQNFERGPKFVYYRRRLKPRN